MKRHVCVFTLLSSVVAVRVAVRISGSQILPHIATEDSVDCSSAIPSHQPITNFVKPSYPLRPASHLGRHAKTVLLIRRTSIPEGRGMEVMLCF